jgi:hypothetical protein
MVSRIVCHADTANFERYALNCLSKDALLRHKEHLAVCEECQELQVVVGYFAGIVQQELAKPPQEKSDQRWSATLKRCLGRWAA